MGEGRLVNEPNLELFVKVLFKLLDEQNNTETKVKLIKKVDAATSTND